MKYSLTRPGYKDQEQNLVCAVKTIRSIFGFSLKEAKDLCESARYKPMIPIVFERLEVVADDQFDEAAKNLLTCGYALKAITTTPQLELRSNLEANAKLAIDLDNIQLAIDLLKLRQVHF